MPGARLITISGARQVRELAADLRRQRATEINDRLRRELTETARPVAAAVRASVRATPSKGQTGRAGRRSLRAKIAAATEVKVRTTRRPTVVVWVNPQRMPPGEGNLPGYLDGRKPFTRWRHQTYGHRPWVTQRPHPYFDRATSSAAPAAQRAGARVVDQISKEIARG
ncbi:hypothetical protein [Streptomyces sp.]|uniref:hypothetical protein n=1 Tax=Streptomyces sp. TaxID=1931 RepID=UPI002F93B999